jgi:hypothetical protein
MGRTREEMRLEWPSGCLCDLEVSESVADTKGWSVLEVRLDENGNRVGMLLPAVQKYQFYRLICDDEAVR